MKFEIHLTQDAFYDLEEIYSYLIKNNSPSKAKSFLNKLEEKINQLTTYPNKGTYPKELLDFGIKEYREIYLKTYRIIYRIIDSDVYIFIVSDGRRDFRSLLERRLLS